MKNCNGLNLLRSRPIHEPFDTISFEKKAGLSLPPKYKLFLESYYIGSYLASGQLWDEFKRQEVFNEVTKRYYFITNNINNLNKDDFFLNQPDICIDIYYELSEDSELFFEHGVADCFPIGAGNGVNSPGLFVGIKDYNIDKIYLENSGLRKGKWTLIANNIFEFIRGFEVVEYTKEECDKYKFTYDKLYKNWGEDFWRVREDS
jgi:hypothetical protein